MEVHLRCDKTIHGRPCGYEWVYRGKSQYRATCPQCGYKVDIIDNERSGV